MTEFDRAIRRAHIRPEPKRPPYPVALGLAAVCFALAVIVAVV